MSIVSDHVPPSAPSTPNPESSLHAELLEQLKTQVPEALFQMVSGRLNAYAQELEYSKLKIQVLEERLRLQRIEKYGPGSEKLSSLQLELLEQEPGVSREEVVAESERPAPPPVSARKKRPHPGRQTLPADLARVERVIACTPEQCVCGNCGRDTTVIGYEVSEVLPPQRRRPVAGDPGSHPSDEDLSLGTPAECRAGAVFRRSDQAGETGLQNLSRARRDGRASSRPDHR